MGLQQFPYDKLAEEEEEPVVWFLAEFILQAGITRSMTTTSHSGMALNDRMKENLPNGSNFRPNNWFVHFVWSEKTHDRDPH